MEPAAPRGFVDLEDMPTSAEPPAPPGFVDPENMPAPAPPRGTKAQPVGALDVMKTSFASDRGEAVNFLAQKVFPDIPVEEAKKFFTEKDGMIAFRDPEGKEHVIADSLLKRLALGVGPSLPIGTGTAAGIASMPLAATGIGTLGTIGLTGGAAAAGEAARQKIGDYLMDTPDPSLNAGSILFEGGMGAAGQGLGKGMAALSERYAVRDLAKMSPTATKNAYSQAQRHGVDLTPGEATGLPSLKAQQKRLGNITATSDDMASFYEKRNDQVFSAWDDFLGSISKNGDADSVAESARSAAQKSISDVRAARSAAAAPHYEAAFADDVTVDTAPILNGLDERLGVAKGGIKAALTSARNLLVDGDRPDTRLRALHEAKMALDDMIEGARESGMGNTAKRELVSLKNQLLDAMDDASPDYTTARQIFSNESGAVDDAMNSTVKILAGLKDVNLQRATTEILNPGTRSAGTVARARALLEKADPEAWQGIKRIYLQQEMDKAFRVSQSGAVQNPAGKLYATLTRTPQLRNLKAAMTGPEYARFTEFMDVMKRASSVKQIGSDTAWNQEANKEAFDAARPFLAKVAKNINPLKALENAADFFTNRNLEKNAQTMVDVITSGDPEAVKVLRELRKLSPKDMRWRALVGHLLTRGGVQGAQELAQ